MAQDVAAPPLLNPLDVDTTPHTDAVRPEHAGKAAHRDPVRKALTTKSIAEVANIVASRVRFELGAVAIQRNRERAEARYAKTVPREDVRRALAPLSFPVGIRVHRPFQRAGEAYFSTSGYGGAATIESSDACSFAVSNTQS